MHFLRARLPLPAHAREARPIFVLRRFAMFDSEKEVVWGKNYLRLLRARLCLRHWPFRFPRRATPNRHLRLCFAICDSDAPLRRSKGILHRSYKLVSGRFYAAALSAVEPDIRLYAKIPTARSPRIKIPFPPLGRPRTPAPRTGDFRTPASTETFSGDMRGTRTSRAKLFLQTHRYLLSSRVGLQSPHVCRTSSSRTTRPIFGSRTEAAAGGWAARVRVRVRTVDPGVGFTVSATAGFFRLRLGFLGGGGGGVFGGIRASSAGEPQS